MWEEIQSSIRTSWVGFAIAIFLLIAGWKMNAPIANWLLLIAWAILVGTFYRTPFVTGQPLIPMCLLLAAFGVVLGLVIYYSLWTNIEKTALDIRATTSAAERPFGQVIGGIHWGPKYGDLRIAVSNTSKMDYQGVDLVFVPDVPITKASHISNIQGVSIWSNEDPTVTFELLDKGKRIDMLYAPIASTLGYRMRCEILPANSQIELILAAVTMNDDPTSKVEDKLLRVNFGPDNAVWLAHQNHSQNIFKDKPIPRIVKVTGHYMAQGAEYAVLENPTVTDVILGSIKSLPKP